MKILQRTFVLLELKALKINHLYPKKSRMIIKHSEVQKSAKKKSHGLDFGNDIFIDLKHNKRYFHNKGGLISEGIVTLVPLPVKSAKSLPLANSLNKLITVITIGRKYKFSAQGSDLAPFVDHGNKIKVPSEIKPPLVISSYLDVFHSKGIFFHLYRLKQYYRH